MDFRVLLADRTAHTSLVRPDPQGKSSPFRAWPIGRPEAIRAGHWGQFEIQPLAVERAGDDESLSNLVGDIHAKSLPAELV